MFRPQDDDEDMDMDAFAFDSEMVEDDNEMDIAFVEGEVINNQ